MVDPKRFNQSVLWGKWEGEIAGVNIADIRCHEVAVPRVYQTRVAPAGGHGQGKTGSRYILVELVTDDGAVGLGEIPDIEPSWGQVDATSLQANLQSALCGDPVSQLDGVERAGSAVGDDAHREFRRALTFAVDCALWDLRAKRYGAPLYELLGGLHRPCVGVTWVAFIRGVDEIEQEIGEKAAEGFRAYKLKVGEDFKVDCDRIRAARRLAGPDAHLRVDASGAWEVEEAIACLGEMAELGVDAVETPIGAASRTVAKERPEVVNENADAVAADLARVRQATSVAVIEHVGDFDDRFAMALVRHGAVDAFNVIPCQAGGLARSLRLLSLAEAAGIDALLGSTVELSPGTAAAVHLGCAAPSVTMASDLVGPGLLTGDVAKVPVVYDRGTLAPPVGPGLGVELDPRKMDMLRA